MDTKKAIFSGRRQIKIQARGDAGNRLFKQKPRETQRWNEVKIRDVRNDMTERQLRSIFAKKTFS